MPTRRAPRRRDRSCSPPLAGLPPTWPRRCSPGPEARLPGAHDARLGDDDADGEVVRLAGELVHELGLERQRHPRDARTRARQIGVVEAAAVAAAPASGVERGARYDDRVHACLLYTF